MVSYSCGEIVEIVAGKYKSEETATYIQRRGRVQVTIRLVSGEEKNIRASSISKVFRNYQDKIKRHRERERQETPDIIVGDEEKDIKKCGRWIADNTVQQYTKTTDKQQRTSNNETL